MDRRIQIVTDLLSKQDSLVFEIYELALSRGISLSGLFHKRSIFFPRFIGSLLGFGEQFVCIGSTEQSVAQAYFGNTDFFKSCNGAHAFLIHPGKSLNERLECTCGVSIPHGLELLGRHA